MSTESKRARNSHQPTGQWIRRDKRLAIYLRDHFSCLYCLADLTDADPSGITLDHLIPVSDGGTNESKNLVTACRHCNCSRQDAPVGRFAGRAARAHISRNVRRSLRKYLALARDILAGKADRDSDLEAE